MVSLGGETVVRATVNTKWSNGYTFTSSKLNGYVLEKDLNLLYAS